MWRGLSDCTIHDFRGLRRRLSEHQQPGGIRRVKRAGNWKEKGGCRQGSSLGTRGRRVNADSQAYLEMEEEGRIQTGEHTWNWRKKGGCRQRSLLETRGRRVNSDREVYLQLEEEGWMQTGKHT